MKKTLMMSVTVLVATIAMRAVFDAKAQDFVTPVVTASTGKMLTFTATIAGEPRHWMTIEAHNGDLFEIDGFHPSYTSIVADYKPIVRKLASGQWEIQFTSEIAEGLP
jgi:hypothetical protein